MNTLEAYVFMYTIGPTSINWSPVILYVVQNKLAPRLQARITISTYQSSIHVPQPPTVLQYE